MTIWERFTNRIRDAVDNSAAGPGGARDGTTVAARSGLADKLGLLRISDVAAGIAVINSSGALSGFVAPWIIGLAKQRTGLFTGGLLVVAASLALGALLVLLVPASADN